MMVIWELRMLLNDPQDACALTTNDAKHLPSQTDMFQPCHNDPWQTIHTWSQERNHMVKNTGAFTPGEISRMNCLNQLVFFNDNSLMYLRLVEACESFQKAQTHYWGHYTQFVVSNVRLDIHSCWKTGLGVHVHFHNITWHNITQQS